MVKQLVARNRVAVFERKDHGVAQSATARKNCHLRDWVTVVERSGNQSVAGLVIGGVESFLILHQARLLLWTTDYSVDSLVEGRSGDLFLVLASSQQGCLVEHVCQISSGESWSAASNQGQIDIVTDWLALGVHLEDLLTTSKVRCANTNLSVKATRTQQGRVKDVWAVSCRDQNHVGLRIEAVHFDQQLVQSLFALVVTATDAGTTVTTNSVDFVDKDDGWCSLLGLVEEVTYTRRTDTDEHFDEVRTRDREERNAGFTGNCLCDQGLACSRWTVKQDTSRNLGAYGLKLGWFFEEFFDFLKLFECFFSTGNVGKSDS